MVARLLAALALIVLLGIPAFAQKAAKCVNAPNASGTAPVLDALNSPGAVSITGSFVGAAGTAIQVCVDGKRVAQTVVASGGSFSSTPITLKPGDIVTARTFVSGHPATYGILSEPVSVGTCSADEGTTPVQPTLDPISSLNLISGTLGTKAAGVVRVCVKDEEVARTPVGSGGIFAMKLTHPLIENEQVTVQQVTSAAGIMPEKYGPVSKPLLPPPSLFVCVNSNPGATAAISLPTPTLNPVDPGSSVTVTGTLASLGGGNGVQICVNNTPKAQAQLSSAGAFTAPATVINSGDEITAQVYITGPPASYGPLSAPAMAGKCSVVGGSAPAKPTLDPLRAANLVSGTLSVKASGPVRVCVNDREVTRTVADTTGNFAARLPQSLTANQQVTAQQITSASNVLPETYGPPSNAVTLQPSQANAECDGTTPRPYLNTPPVEGIKHMVGCSEAGAAYTQIYVYNTPPAACPVSSSSGPQPTLSSVSGAPDANGRFTTDFVRSSAERPYLAHGQWICVLDFNPDGSVINNHAIPILVKTWDVTESSAPWGRVHMYVSGGVVFSQTNSQFSNEDLFVGLDVDSNWYRGRHIMLNTFFDAQMTSAPAAACQTSGSSSSSSSTCQNSSSTSTNSFITSQKAGVVQGGLYMPITSDAWRWSYGGRDNAFFFAPIFKAGIETLTSNTETVSTPTGGSSTSQTITGANVFPFYSIGFRLGQFGMPHSWNKAPYLLTFLDATIGKWYSFQQCAGSVCTYSPNTNPSLTTTVNLPVPNDMLFPLMIEFEGRLKVPKTPILVGFDSYTPATHVANLHGDLRFLFGVRLDVGCIYSAFKGGSTPSITSCTEGTSTPATPTPSGQSTPAKSTSSGSQTQ